MSDLSPNVIASCLTKFLAPLPFGLFVALSAGAVGTALGLAPSAASTLGLTVLCAYWWVTEPVPIAVTGLVPLAALPLMGVLTHKEAAAAYGHPLILLLLGGLILSSALERSRAHRRLALYMVRLVGGSSRKRLVLGFMLASAALSMWISNTATTLMLVPVALAIVEQDSESNLAGPLLLGIAYSASIGGLGTPIGTPPNALFLAIFEQSTGTPFSFLRWMTIGVPMVAVLLPCAWWVLTRKIRGGKAIELPKPGPWRPAERRVLWVFGLTALAWVTRAEPFGGWSKALGIETAGDSTVALAATVVLFLTPSGEHELGKPRTRLLDWSTAEKVPWGLLLLFAGGMALAKGFQSSGLSEAAGQILSSWASLPLLPLMIGLALAVSFLTEVTSNTATSAVLLPILAAAAAQAQISAELLMIPAVISASCAFMMPVATAPNAIVFSSGHLSGKYMARTGVGLNLLCAVVVSIVCYGLFSSGLVELSPPAPPSVQPHE